MRSPIDVEDLRPALFGCAGELAEALLGHPNRAMSTRRQLRFGKHGALSIEIAGPNVGLWCDHSEGSGGDLFSLIQRERGCSFPEALEFAAEFVGSAPVRRPVLAVSDESDAESIEKKKALARQIWAATEPFSGSPSEAYLRGRGINPPPRLGEAIRFHPGIHIGIEIHSAMVAAIRDIHSDELIGVHLTAIDQGGCAIKVDGKTLRRIRGNKKGGAIKLTPDADISQGLLVGEGIETVLSAMEIEEAQGWSVLDAGELKAFPVLDGIESLTIAVDADEKGEDAARQLAARWLAAGRDVIWVQPNTEGLDCNDIVRSAVNERN